MRTAAALVALVCMLGLGGCAAERTVPAEQRSTLTAVPATDAAAVGCVDGSVHLTGPGDYDIGDCANVDVEGTDITARLGDVGVLTLHGDRVTLTAGNLQSVDIEGNDDVVTIATAGTVVLRGDRNTLTVSGLVGTLTLGGNDDVVTSAGIGTADVKGDRNTVTP